METARHSEDVPDLVVARRFELLDSRGRTRVIIGDQGGGGEEWAPGVSLLDEHGNERVTLTLTGDGPALSFVAGGNVVMEIGVGDPGTEILVPGPYVVLAASSGEAAWELYVSEDGSVMGVDGSMPAT